MKFDEVTELRKEARRRLDREDKNLAEFVSLGVGTTDTDDEYRLSARIRTQDTEADVTEDVRRRLADLVRSDDLDVQFTGPVFALRPGEPGGVSTRLTIGSSISHEAGRSGTLGFFARSLVGAQELGIVSANHVISRQDRGNAGESILHPGGNAGGQPVAKFVRDEKLGGGGKKFADCAFASLDPAIEFDPSILPDGSRLQPQIAVLGESIRVKKFGSATQERSGLVTSFDKDNLRIRSYRRAIGVVEFDDQIEIQSDSERRFSLDGDSGALVYNDNGRAVGLLFAHTVRGGRNNHGFSYVNPISRVLASLQVDLVVAR